MAKRKKYPKLPNGYGQIKYLGKNRRNPYAVYPPVKEFDENGKAIMSKALCYVDDWMKGFAILTAYRAGTYTPGMEKELNCDDTTPTNAGSVVQRILADYNLTKNGKLGQKTFEEVYNDFYDYKYERDKSRNYSTASKNSTRAAFKNCMILHKKPFADLRHKDLQEAIDSCKLKHSSLELIGSLLHQMYEYAIVYELVDKDYSTALKINIPDDDEHGVPFTPEELEILWKNRDNDIVEFILIMCYSGYRLSAYKKMEVNLVENYFKGGVKTKYSKDRIVPIHSGILPLVKHRLREYGCLLPQSNSNFRCKMYEIIKVLNIGNHTPHDCRHTFSALCEKYGISNNDRSRMLGHSFRDITNKVYGHRELEDLRAEIEKIQICY